MLLCGTKQKQVNRIQFQFEWQTLKINTPGIRNGILKWPPPPLPPSRVLTWRSLFPASKYGHHRSLRVSTVIQPAKFKTLAFIWATLKCDLFDLSETHTSTVVTLCRTSHHCSNEQGSWNAAQGLDWINKRLWATLFAILSTYVILLKYHIYMLFWSHTCVCASEKSPITQWFIADFYWAQGAAPNEESYSYANVWKNEITSYEPAFYDWYHTVWIFLVSCHMETIIFTTQVHICIVHGGKGRAISIFSLLSQ